MTSAKITLVIASGNKGKLKEFSHLLEPLAFQVKSQAEFNLEGAAETGLTFVENALLKARSVAEQTGHAALGDDSGLIVPALAGAPGLYSARYAGEHGNALANNSLLLDNMAHLANQQRNAYFHCTLVLLRNPTDPDPIIAIGRWWGRIANEPSGSHGFGYDPIFVPNGKQCTAAELPATIKADICHRGIASQLLIEQL